MSTEHEGCRNKRNCINGAWCERLKDYVEHQPKCKDYEKKTV